MPRDPRLTPKRGDVLRMGDGTVVLVCLVTSAPRGVQFRRVPLSPGRIEAVASPWAMWQEEMKEAQVLHVQGTGGGEP